MNSTLSEQIVSSTQARDDGEVCQPCRAIDIRKLLETSIREQVDNDIVAGTWRVTHLDKNHIMTNASSCSLCRLWVEATILEVSSASDRTLAQAESSTVSIAANSLELRAFDPGDENDTCWNFEFDRYGALRGLMPKKVLFVCRTGSRPYRKSEMTPKRRRVGTLLALFDDETWKSRTTRSAPAFGQSLEELNEWCGRETSELVYHWDMADGRTKMVCKRLIDCEKFEVVPAEEGMQYLALSYCWSLAEGDLVDWADVSPEFAGRPRPEPPEDIP